VRPEVRGACELLGLDPLYIANEGKLLAICAPEDAELLLAAMRDQPLGTGAGIVGKVTRANPGLLTMYTSLAQSGSSICWPMTRCLASADAMHEIGIANAIIEAGQIEAARRAGSRLVRIGVRVGTLSGVDNDALRFAFTALTQEQTSMPSIRDSNLPAAQSLSRLQPRVRIRRL